MADIRNIAGILIDMGHEVKCVRDHGLIVHGDEFSIFTGEYARFRQNPNLYYFKDGAAAAADFIDDGLRTLVWTQEDIESSLDCENGKLIPLYNETVALHAFNVVPHIEEDACNVSDICHYSDLNQLILFPYC